MEVRGPEEGVDGGAGAASVTPVGLSIRALETDDIEPMATAFIAMGWPDRRATLERYLFEQETKGRPVFVAFVDDAFAGYVTVSWQSGYEHFATAGIPEIQDLNVIASFRRQRVASALVDAAEALIRTRSKFVGIGFGMYSDYGPAQRMYVRRGYVPDGRGMSRNGKTLGYGEEVVVDDGLELYLVRALDD